ncbi:hypothetical protein Tco_1103420 [Tanacetum coccineum]
MNVQSEMLLVQGEIANVAQREFTPPIEEVSYVRGQSLLASPLLHACVETCHVKPNVSRNVKRSMRTANIRADRMAQTGE